MSEDKELMPEKGEDNGESFIPNDVTDRKKRKKTKAAADMSMATRYSPRFDFGLNDKQIEERRENGFINVTSKKKGRSYIGIICGNVFTFFNVLTFIVAVVFFGHNNRQYFDRYHTGDTLKANY